MTEEDILNIYGLSQGQIRALVYQCIRLYLKLKMPDRYSTGPTIEWGLEINDRDCRFGDVVSAPTYSLGSTKKYVGIIIGRRHYNSTGNTLYYVIFPEGDTRVVIWNQLERIQRCPYPEETLKNFLNGATLTQDNNSKPYVDPFEQLSSGGNSIQSYLVNCFKF